MGCSRGIVSWGLGFKLGYMRVKEVHGVLEVRVRPIPPERVRDLLRGKEVACKGDA